MKGSLGYHLVAYLKANCASIIIFPYVQYPRVNKRFMNETNYLANTFFFIEEDRTGLEKVWTRMPYRLFYSIQKLNSRTSFFPGCFNVFSLCSSFLSSQRNIQSEKYFISYMVITSLISGSFKKQSISISRHKDVQVLLHSSKIQRK